MPQPAPHVRFAQIVQLLLALTQWWWSFVLSRGGHLFDAGQYRYFVAIAPQDTWALIAALAATVGTIAMVHLPQAAKLGCFAVQAFWYALVTACFVPLHPPVTGTMVYGAAFLTSLALAWLCWATRKERVLT